MIHTYSSSDRSRRRYSDSPSEIDAWAKTVRPMTSKDIREMDKQELATGAGPFLNCYPRGQDAPEGHRQDCDQNAIILGNCQCRRIAAYQAGGMDVVDELDRTAKEKAL